MFSRLAAAIGLTILALLPVSICVAGEEEPIVWVSGDRSLSGTKTVELYPSVPTTSDAGQAKAIRTITDLIRNALQGAGVSVVDMEGGQHSSDVGLQIQLVLYTPGNVGGRWVGFGGGAAICIIRAHVLDAPTGVQIGDVVVAEQVGAGGLFTIGVEEHVVRTAARKMAEELAKFFGVKLQPSEEAE